MERAALIGVAAALAAVAGGCGVQVAGSTARTQVRTASTSTDVTAADVWSDQPPVVTDEHGCGYGSRWEAKRKACRLRPAGPPHGQAGYGELRMVREPIVELFPPDPTYNAPSFWIYMRLNRRPTHLIDTSLDGARHDLDTPLGIDKESKDGRCVAIQFDIPARYFTRALYNPRPGESVTVSFQDDHRARRTASTRIRLALPHEVFGDGAETWFKALGCRTD